MPTRTDSVTLSRGQLDVIKQQAAAAALAQFNVGLIAAVEALFAKQGVSRLPKVEAQAWTLGQNIYWSAATECTTDSAAGPLIGTAAAPAANPSTLCYVALAGVVPRTTLTDVGAAACAGGSAPTATQVNAALTPVIDKLNALLNAMRNGAVS